MDPEWAEIIEVVEEWKESEETMSTVPEEENDIERMRVQKIVEHTLKYAEQKNKASDGAAASSSSSTLSKRCVVSTQTAEDMVDTVSRCAKQARNAARLSRASCDCFNEEAQKYEDGRKQLIERYGLDLK